MGAKPAKVCKLEKGKLLGTQKDFVDTFNWLVDWIQNLSCDGDTGLRIDATVSDKPKIKLAKGKNEIEVVTSISYSTSTHALTYKTVKLKCAKVRKSEKTRTVFTATPLSEA